jgi:hypothetical protein
MWSQYQQGKTRKKLNICRRTMTMTSRRKKIMRKKKNRATRHEGEEDEDYTPWSNTEKDETFHDVDEIKTFGDEAPIPTDRLRDLLNRINITTLPEFRIKKILRPGREEYKAIVEIISGPNVLSQHKGLQDHSPGCSS